MSSSRSRSSRVIRAVVALVLGGSVLAALLLLWNDQAAPPDPDLDPPRTSGSAEVVVPPDLDPAGIRSADASVERQQVDAASTDRMTLQELLRPGWRQVSGVTLRKENRWPVFCDLRSRDAEGKDLGRAGRSTFAGIFQIQVPPDAGVLVASARNRYDLAEVVIPLPPGRGLEDVEILLPKAYGSIKGQVIDERGHPVDGITVNLNGSYARRTTGSTGTFLFRNLRDGSYNVVIPGLPFAVGRSHSASVQLIKGKQDQPVMLQVERGATLVGLVEDAQTGRPIESVSVVLGRPGEDREHRSAVTDARGSFRFHRLVAGSYQINATVADSTYSRTTVLVEDLDNGEERRVRLTLQAGAGSLAGKMVDEKGDAVPFAMVTAARSPATEPLGDSTGLSAMVSTRSDSRGLFRFASLPVGDWLVSLDPGYCETHNWIFDQVPARIDDGVESKIEVRLRHGFFIRGRVTSAGNRTGLLVRMTDKSGESVEEPVGAEGRFAFGGLGSGSYTVEVFDPTLPGGPIAQTSVFIANSSPGQIVLEAP